jgi:hypothetical protein
MITGVRGSGCLLAVEMLAGWGASHDERVGQVISGGSLTVDSAGMSELIARKWQDSLPAVAPGCGSWASLLT